MKTSIPAAKGTNPNITGGKQSETEFSVATNGAIIDPILAMVDADPTPIFRTIVGNNSAAQMQTQGKAIDIPVTPQDAKATVTQSGRPENERGCYLLTWLV